MADLHDSYSISQLIARFANSFDLKQWNKLAECLADTIYTDYSELRKTPPEILSKEKFVELREYALKDLKTHHLSTNIETLIDNNSCQAKVSTVIFRKDEAGNVFNTHCLYLFEIKKTAGTWLIHSIVQKVFWSDGVKSIHKGINS